MPLPLIAYPYPTQIVAGQSLDANPVQQDFTHVASAYNAHTHVSAEITDLAAFPAAAALLPIGGIFMWPGPTSFATYFWFCDGASFWVATYSSLASACGTYYGGNASIGRVPPVMPGRTVAGWGASTTAHTDVATIGNTEASSYAARRPAHGHPFTSVANADSFQPGAQGFTRLSTIDAAGPAYIVMPFLIRAI